MNEINFYVSGYAQRGTPGIGAYSFRPETGGCRITAECALLENPSYLLCHPSKAVLYAVEELQPEGRIAALSTDSSELRQLCAFPSGGADPCHLSLSPDAGFLFVSNYTSGSLTVFALDAEGVPTGISDFVQHSMDAQDKIGANPVRQECAHVHFSFCGGEQVFVCDLGLDRVFVYGWDAARGKLTDRGEQIEFPKGSGPRHLAFSDDGQTLYVLCELNSHVYVFTRDGKETWQCLQAVSTLPEDFTHFADFRYSTGAAVRIAEGTLYASNRGHDSIACFRIAEDGKLHSRQIFSSGGKTPRDFQVIEDHLIAANQDSGDIEIFRRNAETGECTPVKRVSLAGMHPSCICLIPEKHKIEKG